MAGIANKGDGVMNPSWEWGVDTQFPLADLTFGDVAQHALDHGTEFGENAHHRGLGTLGRVCGVGSCCEVGIGLGGREVVDGVVGDGVGDNVALCANPAGEAVAVDKRKQLGSSLI